MDKILEGIISEVTKTPLRSSVITAAAVIDSTLEKLITKYLIKDAERLDLFRGNGCLSSFSSKNKMAYAMGLISKELYDDINSFRIIRNKCAHELTIDDSAMNSICDRVKNFNLLHKAFQIGEGEQIVIYTALEFTLILLALIRRMNTIERQTEFPFEMNGEYFTLDSDDYKIINEFSKHIQ